MPPPNTSFWNPPPVSRPVTQSIRRSPVSAIQDPRQDLLDPEQDDDNSLMDYGTSALGAIANVIDLPGSMVRDVLTLRNPFDQLLNPFTHGEQRDPETGKVVQAGGREIMEMFGAPANKETGWVPFEDPKEFGLDVAGFGVELLTDPLGWLTGWMKGVSVANRASKMGKATTLIKQADEAAKVAGDAASTWAAKAGTGAFGRSGWDAATTTAARADDLARRASQARAAIPPLHPSGNIRRAVSKTGDVIDKWDPGHQLGLALYNNKATRELINTQLINRIRKVQPLARAGRWIDKYKTPAADDTTPRGGLDTPGAGPLPSFPSGGERARFADEARQAFGEEADEYMPVIEARAGAWAKENDALPDDYFKDLSVQESDIDSFMQSRKPAAAAARAVIPDDVKPGDTVEIFDITGKRYSTEVIDVSELGSLRVFDEAKNEVILDYNMGSATTYDVTSPEYPLDSVESFGGKPSSARGRKVSELTDSEIDEAELIFTERKAEAESPESIGATPGVSHDSRLQQDINALRLERKARAAEYEDYVRTGNVQQVTIDRIVKKIISGEDLTEAEISIRMGAADEIESRLKEFNSGRPSDPDTLLQGEAAAVETPEFKEWFGDSKVVDEGGKPLRVYHGSTQKGLQQFDLGEAIEVEGGIFFSSRDDVASDYTFERAYGDIIGEEPSGDLVEAYLSLQNPLVYKTKAKQRIVDAVEMGRAIDEAKKKGHDGLVIKDIDDSVSGTGEIGDVYVAFDPTQIKSVNNRGTFDPSDPNILFHPAYHGSAHRFDKFLLHKIGSGEGAQAYGWGLYFTDTKAIAQNYKKGLTHYNALSEADLREYFTPGRKVLSYGSHEDIVEEFDWNGGSWVVTVRGTEPGAKLRRHGTEPTDDEFVKAMGRKPDKGGALYEVDLAPKQDEYLLWDEPLSKQSKKVREALAGEIELLARRDAMGLGQWAPTSRHPRGSDLYLQMTKGGLSEPGDIRRIIDSTPGVEGRIKKGEIEDTLYDAIAYHRNIRGDLLTPDDIEVILENLLTVRGTEPRAKLRRHGDEYIPEAILTDDPAERSMIINSLVDAFRGAIKNRLSPEGVSRAMRKKGVRGVKYSDGFSRGKSGKKSYNYVIFDDTDVAIQKILRQEGAARGAPRGAVVFKDSKRVIHAFASADISTLAHESAHVFRRDLSEELLKQAESAIDKIIDGNVRGADDNWTREAEEAFASGFERYLRDGTAPSEQLKGTFAKFKEWLTDIYKRIVGTPLEKNVSPELKKVFSQMLGAEEGAKIIPPARRRGVEDIIPAKESASQFIRRKTADVGDVMRRGARTAKLTARQKFYQPARQFLTGPVQEGSISAHGATQAFDEYAQAALMPVIDTIVNARSTIKTLADRQQWHRKLDTQIVDAMESKTLEINRQNYPDLPDGLHEELETLRSWLHNDLLEHATAANINVQRLQDDMVHHLHRQMNPAIKEALEESGEIAKGTRGLTSDPAVTAHRAGLFKESLTSALNEAVTDDELYEILDRGREIEKRGAEGWEDEFEQVMEEAATRIRETAGDRITEEMKAEWGATKNDSSKGFILEAEADQIAGVKPELQYTYAQIEKMPKEGGSYMVEQKIKVGGETDVYDVAYKIKTESRTRALADYVYVRGDMFKNAGGLFDSPFASIRHYLDAASRIIHNGRTTTHVLTNGLNTGVLRFPLPGIKTLKDQSILATLLNQAQLRKFNKEKVYQTLYDTIQSNERWKTEFDNVFHLGENPGIEAISEAIGQFRLDSSIREDLLSGWKILDHTDAGPIAKGFQSFTALFKAGVLTYWPARITRDGMTGQIQNMLHGVFSKTSFTRMFNVLYGRPDESLLELPEVLAYVKKQGWEQTGENATKAARRMFGALRGHSSSMYHELVDLSSAQDIESLQRAMPGTGQSVGDIGVGKTVWNFITDVAKSALPRAEDGSGINWRKTLGFWDVAGVGDRKKTGFGLAVAGELLGKYMDDANRIVPWLESMRRGVSSSESMRIANKVQLNYDPRTFTPTEQQLKKIFPFYSFFTRELAYLASELTTNPTGRLGKLLRVTSQATPGEDEESFIPDYMRDTLAIPWGESKDGGRSYFTAGGLMHEDPLSTVGSMMKDPSEGSRSLIARSHPLAKLFIEGAFGESSYFGGPMGGRELSSLDPPVGRLLESMGLQEELPSGLAKPLFDSPLLEQTLTAMPTTRVVNTARTLLDDRKSLAEKAINTLTGMKITTVSPSQARSGLRALGDSIAKDAGARPFTTFSITKDSIDELAKTDPSAARKLDIIRRKRDTWNKERRAGIRRSAFAAGVDAVKSGQSPTLNKGQTGRHQRWVRNFGRHTIGSNDWAQYVYQTEADGTPKKHGIKAVRGGG